MSTSRVMIVGAGPGGLAAARRLKDRAGDSVEVVLCERDGSADYLPGTIPTLLGETPPEHWRRRISILDVEVRAGEVDGVSGSGVTVNGERIEADAVVAAPGLRLDAQAVPALPGLFALWDPDGADAATGAVHDLRDGTVAVVISSLPYRCPPAPYGMAMQLAALYRAQGRDVGVVLTTPEEEPLSALGGGIPEFLRSSCASAGVELRTGFLPDLPSMTDGNLRFAGGESLGCDLALVVPPHVRSPLLAGLPGDGPLVEVDARFESAEAGLFVVGDAAATPLPRAADAAAAAGRTAADAVLDWLGLVAGEAHLPEPECFVGHGGGLYSRISLRFPEGLPPEGRAAVTLEGPDPGLAEDFEAAFARWQALRGPG